MYALVPDQLPALVYRHVQGFASGVLLGATTTLNPRASGWTTDL